MEKHLFGHGVSIATENVIKNGYLPGKKDEGINEEITTQKDLTKFLYIKHFHLARSTYQPVGAWLSI